MTSQQKRPVANAPKTNRQILAILKNRDKTKSSAELAREIGITLARLDRIARQGGIVLRDKRETAAQERRRLLKAGFTESDRFAWPKWKEREPTGCRFIVDDSGRGVNGRGWRFCQKTQAAGKPYCPEHQAISRRPDQPDRLPPAIPDKNVLIKPAM